MFLVRIDLELLRQHLCAEDAREVTLAEVERWLLDAGFIRSGDGWRVREPDLGQLDPAEVISAEVTSEDSTPPPQPPPS
jgi:hypothetical protein